LSHHWSGGTLNLNAFEPTVPDLKPGRFLYGSNVKGEKPYKLPKGDLEPSPGSSRGEHAPVGPQPEHSGSLLQESLTKVMAAKLEYAVPIPILSHYNFHHAVGLQKLNQV
jgi:hypothetical protein